MKEFGEFIKTITRPIIGMLCAFALVWIIIGQIQVSTEQWAFLAAVVSEWVIERAVKKIK